MNATPLHNYSATFLLDTRNYQEPIETLIEKLSDVLSNANASISKVINHGQKEFLRIKDRRFRSGIYVEILFQAPSQAPATIKEKLRLNKNVNRILISSL